MVVTLSCLSIALMLVALPLNVKEAKAEPGPMYLDLPTIGSNRNVMGMCFDNTSTYAKLHATENSGVMWAALECFGGIAKIDPAKAIAGEDGWYEIYYINGQVDTSLHPFFVATDSSGNVWISGEGDIPLIKFDVATKTFKRINGLRANAQLIYYDGNLYFNIGCNNGLIEFNTITEQYIEYIDNDLIGLTPLFFSVDGTNIWMSWASADHGILNKFDTLTKTFTLNITDMTYLADKGWKIYPFHKNRGVTVDDYYVYVAQEHSEGEDGTIAKFDKLTGELVEEYDTGVWWNPDTGGAGAYYVLKDTEGSVWWTSGINKIGTWGTFTDTITTLTSDNFFLLQIGDKMWCSGHGSSKLLVTRIPNSEVDINGDGHINVLDLIRVATKLGWQGQPYAIPEDVTKDGKVNVLDLIRVAQYLGW